MDYLIRSLTILLGWTVLCSDGKVTISVINSVEGRNQLECDTEVTLICEIDPFGNLINWEINGTLYAMCSPTCSENPPFPGNYSFTFDAANGIFNTTINQVTFGDSNTIFKCDDGSEFDNITTEVIPAYSKIETNLDSTDEEYHQVVFTTACVHPEVQFEWFTVKGNDSDRHAYKTNQNKSEDRTSCAFDNNCGGTGTAKVSSTVSVKKVSDGEERYLEAVVTYKNPDGERTFRFNQSFIFEENQYTTITNLPVPNSNTSNSKTMLPTESSGTQTVTDYTTESTDVTDGSNDALIIVSSVIGGGLALPVFAIVIFIVYRWRRNRNI